MAQAVVIGPPLMEGVGFQHVLGRCTAMARDMAQRLAVEMGQFLAKYSPPLAEVCFPLRKTWPKLAIISI